MKINKRTNLRKVAAALFNLIPDDIEASELTMELASGLMTMLSLEVDFAVVQNRKLMQELWERLQHQVEIDIARGAQNV